MKFDYFAGEQLSPEWFQLRIGKVTASRLCDWLATSKKDGSPLKARLDYEKELMFERQFNVAYNNYVSGAMDDGLAYEQFAADQYEKATGIKVQHSGAWFNDKFMASPDRIIEGIGLLEIKIVRDNTFSDILINGVPEKWWLQIQGQLWASGRDWCDFVALNLNTKKFKIINVEPNEEFQERLKKSLTEKLSVPKFDENQLFDIKGEPKAIEVPVMGSVNTSKFGF